MMPCSAHVYLPSPYTPIEEATTIFSIGNFRSRMASSSRAVPMMLLSMYVVMCGVNPPVAASWNTTSTPSRARSRSRGFRTSPRRNSTSGGSGTGRPGGCVGSSRLSSTRTSYPSVSSRSTMCDPMKPAPPVTSFFIARSDPLRGHEKHQAPVPDDRGPGQELVDPDQHPAQRCRERQVIEELELGNDVGIAEQRVGHESEPLAPPDLEP